jgi:hypothetical protein
MKRTAAIEVFVLGFLPPDMNDFSSMSPVECGQHWELAAFLA